MYFNIKGVGLTTAALFTSILFGCSGGSNNLSSGDGINSGLEIVPCKDQDNNQCVQIEFVDDPVVGINYTCSYVSDITTNTGIARCPNNSKLTFFILSADKKHRITLGSTLVQASQRSNLKPENFILRITPLDLIDSKTEITSLNTTEATPAINMTRLLDALRQPTDNFVTQAPVNRIIITYDLREKMNTNLTADVTADDFKSEAFVQKTQDLININKRKLISSEEAKARLNKTLFAVNSGVYYQLPILDTSGSISKNIFNVGIGIRGKAVNNANMQYSMALYALTLRDGSTLGQGLQWAKDIQGVNQLQDAYKMYLYPDFNKMRIDKPWLTRVDPLTHRITKGTFDWQVYGQNANGNELIDTLSFTQGKLIRQLAIIGSNSLYNLYTGIAEPADTTELGRWQQTQTQNSNQIDVAEGSATIFRAPITAVNTFLDPVVWRSEHVVAQGQKYVIPLHATLTFKYAANAGVADAKLGITILENGDIITDTSTKSDSFVNQLPDCKAVTLNKATQQYTQTNGIVEKRIGTVRAAYTAPNQNYFITPTIMLTGKAFAQLDGMQIGTSMLTNRVKVNLTGVINAAKDGTGVGSVNITDATAKNQDSGGGAAQWINLYNVFTQLANNNVKAELTEEQKQLAKQNMGTVNLALSACHQLQTRQ